MNFDYKKAWEDWSTFCEHSNGGIYCFIKDRPDIANQLEEALTYNSDLSFDKCLEKVYINNTKLGKALK